MEPDLSNRIRERAYELWMAHGCREGRAEQDWLFAEREVLSARGLGHSAGVAGTVADSVTSKKSKIGSRMRGRASGATASTKALHGTP